MENTTLRCRLCKTDLPLDTFTPYQQTAPYPRCKPCVSRKSKDWVDRNLERRRASSRKHREENKESEIIRVRIWRQANPDKARAATKRCSESLKNRVFDHYGRSCACCGENIFRFLCIDHINNDGNSHRKLMDLAGGTQFYSWLEKNGFPPEFQTLCYNCNQGKHQNNGVCPHKEQNEASRSTRRRSSTRDP